VIIPGPSRLAHGAGREVRLQLFRKAFRNDGDTNWAGHDAIPVQEVHSKLISGSQSSAPV